MFGSLTESLQDVWRASDGAGLEDVGAGLNAEHPPRCSAWRWPSARARPPRDNAGPTHETWASVRREDYFHLPAHS